MQIHFFFRSAMLLAFFTYLMFSSVQAAKPLWTFVPHTPIDIVVAKGNSTQVIYTISNQTSKVKTLVMKPIVGVTQIASCQLEPRGTCILTLNVYGSVLQGDVLGGPILCEQGNKLQCYQPNMSNSLRIHLSELPPVQKFTITPLPTVNGSISPSSAQVVDSGSSLVFTALPDVAFGVNQWLVDGNVVQSGGTSYQLNGIQANHTIEVTFNQTTLSPLTSNLVLSINSSASGAPTSDPALIGTPRKIRIENTGSVPASNLSVSTSTFPAGTSISNDGCTGITLNAGSTCDITITPGGDASLNSGNNPCTTPPGTEALPSTVTVSADNSAATNINILVLGYGCIYQDGFLFSVDDVTPSTDSIGGKVAALMDEQETPVDFLFQWSTTFNVTGVTSINDGYTNTLGLATPAGQYPAAQACLNKVDNWYLPAICQLARYSGVGVNAGCGVTNPNLYSTLYIQGLGGFTLVNYWSSSESGLNVAWAKNFSNGFQGSTAKGASVRVRCIRNVIN